MGKEQILPKNIRQIGDIHGREKICIEDYVMTYIRKKEPEEDQGYLGIFLGEKKQTEDSDYILIRGILEAPRKGTDQMAGFERVGKNAKAEKKENEKRDAKTEKDANVEWAEEKVIGDTTKEKQQNLNENLEEDLQEHSKENLKEHSKDNSKEETLSEKIQRERRLYFPEWEVIGCCVIGTYPTARMEELAAAIPETADFLYHLQEQEENLYWMKNRQYQRIRGYFVFYEQNKLMQEYMAEVFGSNSVEKESLPDRAIKNFREKIAQKSEKKSRSMLKLASSFFVVTVLVVGAVVVNRVEDIRKVQDQVSPVSGTSNNIQKASDVYNIEESADTGSQAGVLADNQTDVINGSQAGVLADNQTDVINGSQAGVLADNQTDVINGSQAEAFAGEQSAVSVSGQALSDLEDDLAGATAFWEDEYEDAVIANAATIDTDLQNDASETVSGELNADNDISELAATADGAEKAVTGTIETAAMVSLNASDSDEVIESSEVTAGESAGVSAAESAEVSAGESVGASIAESSEVSAGVSAGASIAESSEVSAGVSAAESAEVTAGESAGVSAAESAEVSAGESAEVSAGASAAESTEVQEAAAMRQTHAAYVIKEGDTLADICSRYYGNLDRLTEICETNEIEDANRIMPGQKIVLP